LSKESTKIFEKNVPSVLGIFSFVDTLKKNCLSLMQLAFGFLAKVIYFFAAIQGCFFKNLFASMVLMFSFTSVVASSTTTMSFSMHRASLCDVGYAKPFMQIESTLGECEYQCMALRSCSGMQFSDPKQCLLYDIPFPSVSF